ncbi:hypothetical protein PRUPE_1G487400 [Prunus persica]|uniref:Uncharacterized protein n=1 Tax=Prunus persica TaxID=3760 RepID=A0A251RET5_PRUPE|nr:hypothetical protein PRUPE_1G487400 [Prunus persica]
MVVVAEAPWQKTEPTHFTMVSKAIVFTNFPLAGKTLPFFGLNQLASPLGLPLITSSPTSCCSVFFVIFLATIFLLPLV